MSKAVIIDLSSSGEDDPWSSSNEREVDEMIHQQSLIESRGRVVGAYAGEEASSQRAERNQLVRPLRTIDEVESIGRKKYISPTKGVSFFKKNPESVLIEDDLSTVRSKYGIPASVEICLPYPGELANTQNDDWSCAYTKWFELSLRLPSSEFVIEIIRHFYISMSQLMLNGVRLLIALMVLIEEAGIEFDIFDFLRCYYLKLNSKNLGRCYFVYRQSKQLITKFVNANRHWEEKYFFMSINQDSCDLNARFSFLFAFGHIDRFFFLWRIYRRIQN